MSTVEDFKRKVQSLQDQLHSAKSSLYTAQLAEARLVPDETIVVYKGSEFLLKSVDFAYGNGKGWAYGQKRKKDGGWSSNHQILYADWIVKP